MSCTVNSNSITLATAGGVLEADLIVDPASAKSPNQLSVASAGVYVPSDGWVPLPETLTYASAPGSHIYTANVSADATAFLQVGDRIKLTQAAVVRYFIVVAITAGTVTLYGGQNQVLANAAISAAYFSKAKSPVGFVTDPASGGWYEQLLDTSSRTQAAAVAGTWYNPGSLSLSVPIGSWDLSFQAAVQTGQPNVFATLSNANNSESDSDFTDVLAGPGATTVVTSVARCKPLAVAATTSYYLNVKTDSGATPTIGFRGDLSKTIIRAISAYL